MAWKWTEEEIVTLKDLRSQGLSARKIAVFLQHKYSTKRFSRNSVIGKLHRLGLCLHVSAENHSARISEGLRENKKTRKPRFVSFPLPEPEPAPLTAISFADLDDHHCRYPYGEGSHTVYCGEEKVLGTSYCVEHFNRCYRQAE